VKNIVLCIIILIERCSSLYVKIAICLKIKIFLYMRPGKLEVTCRRYLYSF
jgi:hypothetical protein